MPGDLSCGLRCCQQFDNSSAYLSVWDFSYWIWKSFKGKKTKQNNDSHGAENCCCQTALSDVTAKCNSHWQSRVQDINKDKLNFNFKLRTAGVTLVICFNTQQLLLKWNMKHHMSFWQQTHSPTSPQLSNSWGENVTLIQLQNFDNSLTHMKWLSNRISKNTICSLDQEQGSRRSSHVAGPSPCGSQNHLGFPSAHNEVVGFVLTSKCQIACQTKPNYFIVSTWRLRILLLVLAFCKHCQAFDMFPF